MASSFAPRAEAADHPGERMTQMVGRSLDQKDAQLHAIQDFFRRLNKNMGVRSTGMYKFAGFMFLAVIFGIEFDMTGLIFSCGTYWGYDIFFLKFFLFFSIFAFCAPLAIHVYFTSEESAQAQPPRTPITGGVQSRRGGDGGGFVGWLKDGINTPDPFGGHIRWYHFIPGLRFYLLVKTDADMTDVDAIFRINTLSSFTFGIYQLLCIGFTIVRGYEFTLEVWLNVASQAVNWSITVLYFTTSVSVWMGRATEAKTKSRFYTGLMNEWASRGAEVHANVFGTSAPGPIIEDWKTLVKRRLAQQICQSFGGHRFEGVDAREYKQLLTDMRDSDVKHFIEILRDQTISSMEMNGTL